jgi:hypothetical protein
MVNTGGQEAGSPASQGRSAGTRRRGLPGRGPGRLRGGAQRRRHADVYLVRHTVGHEHCTCPDFQHRQGTCGQPCKHILAAELVARTSP